MIRLEDVVARLRAAEFISEERRVAPFGQELPLVQAFGFEPRTASLALVATADRADEFANWRQLLFAVSGLRELLSRERPAAIGTPYLLALISSETQEAELRALAEELNRDYLLFNRVDLNLLRTDGDDKGAEATAARIDAALAPLLPACRAAVREEATLGPDVLRELQEFVHSEVMTHHFETRSALRSELDAERGSMADDLAASIEVEDTERPRTVPWEQVTLKDFRAFEEVTLPLAPFTLAEGSNGTGKSSFFEALEILLSGTSQRRLGADAATYDKHLARDGRHAYRLLATAGVGDDAELSITNTSEHPAGLRRNSLNQDDVTAFASDSEKDRFSALLNVTGLRIPALDARREQIARDAQGDVNRLLEEIGISAVPTIRSRAADHVSEALGAASLGMPYESGPLEAALDAVHRSAGEQGLSFQQSFDFPEPPTRLVTLRERVATAARDLRSAGEVEQLALNIGRELRGTAGVLRTQANAIRELLKRLPPPEAREETSTRDSPIPAEIARTWIRGMESVQAIHDGLKPRQSEIADPEISDQLSNYLAALREAIAATPGPVLRASLASEQRRPPSPNFVDAKLVAAAGFSGSVPTNAFTANLRNDMARLSDELLRAGLSLETQAESLDKHPLTKLRPVEAELRSALARFELARNLRAPIAAAESRLIEKLIAGRLRPVLTELIAAMSRFEWYFQPLQLSVGKNKLTLGGLATPSSELDARLTLNSAERTVVGLAWFLALHILQPPSARQFLLLDDPLSDLDPTQQAAIVDVLRTLNRRLRPSFMFLSTHDRLVGEMLEREFTSADGWPADFVRIRFERSAKGPAVGIPNKQETSQASVHRDIEDLRLDLDLPALV